MQNGQTIQWNLMYVWPTKVVQTNYLTALITHTANFLKELGGPDIRLQEGVWKAQELRER